MTTYFDALGVSSFSSLKEIKGAFHKLAMAGHPDLGGDPEKFKLITAAYNALDVQYKLDDYAQRVKLHLFTKSQVAWAKQWDELHGVVTVKPTLKQTPPPNFTAPKAKPAPQPKAGKCNAHTTSGPCCRPAGHTPNGHMSQAVADQKRKNQKAKKAAGK